MLVRELTYALYLVLLLLPGQFPAGTGFSAGMGIARGLAVVAEIGHQNILAQCRRR